MQAFLHRFNPAISKRWLLILAGLMWSAVGVMLISYAVNWLALAGWVAALAWGAAGAIFSLIVYRYGFSGIAHKNIRRIKASPERACVFAFQEWKGYAIIAVMMTTGILLRASNLPREPLATLYMTIGGGLFFSSIHYYTHFVRLSPAPAREN